MIGNTSDRDPSKLYIYGQTDGIASIMMSVVCQRAVCCNAFCNVFYDTWIAVCLPIVVVIVLLNSVQNAHAVGTNKVLGILVCEISCLHSVSHGACFCAILSVTIVTLKSPSSLAIAL